MAFIKAALLFTIFACISTVRGNHEHASEDLGPLVASTHEKLQNATTHVNHMVALDPLPNPDKLPSLIKNESDHLAYELNKVAGKLQDVVKEGEHEPAVKDAVAAAVTRLHEAASSLEGAAGDIKQDNSKYVTAADHWLQALKSIQEAGPCDKISPILKDSLKELSHDVDNYQWSMHDLIGAHEGGEPDHAGHHHHEGHTHHTHSHHGSSSSEESNESNSKEHEHHHH